MMISYDKLAIPTEQELVFGSCPNPLTLKSGMVLGGCSVYPELNFTLPSMNVEEGTWPQVVHHYREIASGALARAAELQAPGVQLEFETVPPMTYTPDWGTEITEILVEEIHKAKDATGLRAALRVTPNDNREMERPPVMRSGQYWEAMLETFDRCAAAGADLLSIESVQNLKLLGGMAPTCFMETLEYDCRLFNKALSEGPDAAHTLQRWLVESDASLDPQAYVLTPKNCIAFAEEIVASQTHYEAGRRVAAKAVSVLRDGLANDAVRIPERDQSFLDMIEATLETLPDDEEEFIAQTLPLLDTSKFRPEDYDLAV